MKKTLIITTDFNHTYGGVSSYWQKVIASLPVDKVVLLSQLPSFRYLYPQWLKGIVTIYQTYKSGQCQQIWSDQVLPNGTMVYILHKLFKIPFFLQVHGLDLLSAKKRKHKFYLAKKILQASNLVFCNSQAVARILRHDFGVQHIQVIYPQSDLKSSIDNDLRRRLQKQYQLLGKKVILTVGRLIPRKGQDMMIKALPDILRTCPNAVYVIIGQGNDYHRLYNMAKNVSDQVIFLQGVTPAELSAWYSLCDVFVMPARLEPNDIEGFGIVYLEAYQFKKPVIAGNVGGAVEAVENNVSGLLVDPLDNKQITQAVFTLLNDNTLAMKMGEAGYQLLQTKFSWPKSVNIIQQCLV